MRLQIAFAWLMVIPAGAAPLHAQYAQPECYKPGDPACVVTPIPPIPPPPPPPTGGIGIPDGGSGTGSRGGLCQASFSSSVIQSLANSEMKQAAHATAFDETLLQQAGGAQQAVQLNQQQIAEYQKALSQLKSQGPGLSTAAEYQKQISMLEDGLKLSRASDSILRCLANGGRAGGAGDLTRRQGLSEGTKAALEIGGEVSRIVSDAILNRGFDPNIVAGVDEQLDRQKRDREVFDNLEDAYLESLKRINRRWDEAEFIDAQVTKEVRENFFGITDSDSEELDDAWDSLLEDSGDGSPVQIADPLDEYDGDGYESDPPYEGGRDSGFDEPTDFEYSEDPAGDTYESPYEPGEDWNAEDPYGWIDAEDSDNGGGVANLDWESIDPLEGDRDFPIDADDVKTLLKEGVRHGGGEDGKYLVEGFEMAEGLERKWNDLKNGADYVKRRLEGATTAVEDFGAGMEALKYMADKALFRFQLAADLTKKALNTVKRLGQTMATTIETTFEVARGERPLSDLTDGRRFLDVLTQDYVPARR